MEHLSVSRLKDVRRCERKHHYVWDLRVKALVVAEELIFGDLMHEAQEAWWTVLKLAPGEATPIALEAALAVIDTVPCTDPVCESCPPDEACPTCGGSRAVPRPGDLFMLAAARATIRAYHARWIEETARRYVVLSVERRFEIPLINPTTGALSRTFDLVGRLDVEAIRLDATTGRPELVGVEHKTSGEDILPGSRYWRRLRMDSQSSVYLDGINGAKRPYLTPEMALDDPAAGVVDVIEYNVLGKPGLRPLKATPPEDRKYTKAKTGCCPVCKNKTPAISSCANCKKQGVVVLEEPRLYSNQREADETPQEYGERVYQLLTGEPNRYFQRGDVVRIGEEMDAHRADTWSRAQMILESRRRAAAAPTPAAQLAAHPRNPDACTDYGRLCDFFDVCSGSASLDDTTKFSRRQQSAPAGAAPDPAADPSESKEAP